MLVDFVRLCRVSWHAWVFEKQRVGDSDALVGAMAREVGAFIRLHDAYVTSWDEVVIYYDNGQKKLTNLVNSVFNAHLGNVEVRRVQPSSHSLFQAADLCCTLALLRTKLLTTGLSSSERDFFSTPRDGAERALRKGCLKTMDRKSLESTRGSER